jgi:hypothetical protein
MLLPAQWEVGPSGRNHITKTFPRLVPELKVRTTTHPAVSEPIRAGQIRSTAFRFRSEANIRSGGSFFG